MDVYLHTPKIFVSGPRTTLELASVSGRVSTRRKDLLTILVWGKDHLITLGWARGLPTTLGWAKGLHITLGWARETTAATGKTGGGRECRTTSELAGGRL